MENLFDNFDLNNEEEVVIEINNSGELITTEKENVEDKSTDINPTETSEEEVEGKETDLEIDISEFTNDEDIETDEETENSNHDNIDDSPTSVDTSSPYKAFATALSEEGVITLKDTDEIKSAEDLIKIVSNTIRENEFKDLTENQRLYLDSLRNGIPEDEIVDSFKAINNYSKITNDILENDENLRIDIIKEDYIRKGIDEVKALKLAKRSIDLGEDLDDAKESLTNLKLSEESYLKELNKKADEDRKKADEDYKKNLQNLKETINKTESLIPNLPINSRVKEEVYNNMTKVVSYDKNGTPLNALGNALSKDEKGELKLKINYLFTVTNGFSDFSILSKNKNSKAILELEQRLKASQAGSGSTASTSSRTGRPKGVLKAIENFEFE